MGEGVELKAFFLSGSRILFYREDKPSVLDMSEAVIARLQEKAGAPKDKILKVTSHEYLEL